MSRCLIKNQANNMGDCMSQMRGLKEWGEQHLEMELYFMSNLYLHYIMAKHTDIFKGNFYVDHVIQQGDVDLLILGGVDRIVEFTVDWGLANTIGIVKAWTQSTLGFTPSTNQPYFITTEDEKINARNHMDLLRRLGFRKYAIIQPEAPSDGKRSFNREDWDKIVALFPEDTGVIFPCPIGMAGVQPMTPKKNLLMLPGYGIGETSELLKLVDFSLMTHGGMVMLGHAVGARNIIHVIFNETISNNIHQLDEAEGHTNIPFPSNREVNWEQLQEAVNKYL